jgi:ribosomal protein S18 acetylase RimI-like enzyme
MTIVRPATAADAAIVAEFNIAMAQETESTTLDSGTVLAGVRAGISDPNKAMYFVAEADGCIAGCCMVTHEWSDWRNGDIWWLQSVYVAPQHRRSGVFRAMYRNVESAARSSGAVCLRLYVERDNLNAKETYQAMGMSLTKYDVMEQRLT